MKRTTLATVTVALVCLSTLAQAQGLFGNLLGRARDASGQATEVPPFDFSKPPADQAGAYVDTSGIGRFKDMKRIAIMNFSIEFVAAKEAEVTSRGMGAGSSANTKVRMPPPDPVVLAAIADRLYDQLEADLKAAGLEVLPYDQVTKSSRYAAFKDAQKPSPTTGETKDGRSVFVGAKGRPFYLENAERATTFQAIGLGFGPNTRMGEVMLSYDLGQIHLLSVNMVVDFASLKTSGGFGASRVETNFGHFLHQKNTYYRVSGPNGPEMAKLTLKQVLASDRIIVKSFTKDQERETMGGLMGGNWTMQRVEADADIDAAVYYGRSADMIEAAHAMFMTEIYKARGMPAPAIAASPVKSVLTRASASAAPAQPAAPAEGSSQPAAAPAPQTN